MCGWHLWCENEKIKFIGKCGPFAAQFAVVRKRLINEYDLVCNKVGKCLVGDYNKHVEEELYDLLELSALVKKTVQFSKSDTLPSALKTDTL
jgi:hypothetical protein